jgi:iron(II)-dependent oxidoreductase
MHQSLVPIPPSPPTTSQPAGTVHLPANAAFTFVTKGLEIEGDDAHGVDVQFPWEVL